MIITNSFDLDGDYSMDYMSSGNHRYPYDPVRDSLSQNPISPELILPSRPETDTDRLADYLRTVNNEKTLSKKHISF